MERPPVNLLFVLSLIIIIIIAGASFVHYFEGWNWIDSVYWATTTISTIGYGDLVPQLEITKIFVIFYILIGVSTTVYGLFYLASYMIKRNEDHFENFRKHPKKLPTQVIGKTARKIRKMKYNMK